MPCFEIACLSRSRPSFRTAGPHLANISPRNSTVADVARKVMGDAPIAYVEGAGGTRVAEDQIVSPGKNDVGMPGAICLPAMLIRSCRYCPSKWADNNDIHAHFPVPFSHN